MSGLRPPCKHRNRSSISAAIGKALNEARQASYTLVEYLRMPGHQPKTK